MKLDNLFRIGVLGFRDFLYDAGQVSVKFPEDALYDTRFLEQLDPSLVRLEETVSQNINIVEKNGIYYRQDAIPGLAESPLKCLLADDSRFMRVTVARIIRKLGGQIIGEATTGSEAIEKFTRLRPNVVTMDLSMPGVSGIDAIKEIFKEDPAVNILVISSTNLQEIREQVFNLGVKMFITKPFDAKEVTAILRKNVA
jgi:two-component system chemotaxis response regulator CheY